MSRYSIPELTAGCPKGNRYQKIDLSGVDRKKIKQTHGIDTNEKIKVHDELKHSKELWAYPLSKEENVRCFWDHHPFEGEGVRCPLNYVPKQVAKVDGGYVIKENICRDKKICDPDNNRQIVDVTEAYYEVDAEFCSPECCLAFIKNEVTRSGGSKYADSERLLHFMLGLSTKITPANSFRLLKAYGGNLTIEQFRKSNSIVKYEYCGTTVLTSHLFEKKINLSSL